MKRLIGQGVSDEILSVDPQWQEEEIKKVSQQCFGRLSPEGEQVFGSALAMMDLGQLDSLDARYAREVVDILGKIIARIQRLDKLPPLSSPNESVKLAFQEAQRCYLYGFPKACVALCRATIESALREALRTLGEANLTDETDLYDMLQRQNAKNLLGELRVFANDVRIAGKHAVHHADIFAEQYPANKIQEIVDKTRRLVEHLYALPAA